MALRPLLPVLLALGLAACARNDLAEPPVPLGDFALGLNVAVADKVEMVPISRAATKEEWETSVSRAIAARFGRYQGTKLYNIGISIDGYALAPPGIPLVAAPKSVLAITANIWDDAAGKKLNAEGKQIIVMESLSGETVVGTGYTRTKEQQMEALSYNAAKKVEDWLLEHPEWFGLTPEELKAQLAQRQAAIKAAKAAPAAPSAAVPAPAATPPKPVPVGN